MTRGTAYALLCAFVAMSVALVASRPDWVSDSNSFLAGFVNHEFINVLGVTLAITLASAAQLHLTFNRIEEQYKARNALENTRRELRATTYSLIYMFVVGVAIVVVKPIATSLANPAGQGFFNMAALFVLLWHVLGLVSITQLVFAIEPEFFDEAGDK